MKESAPKGALKTSGAEVKNEPSAEEGHGGESFTVKQWKRYSSVTMEGKLAVRGPGYEAFDLATTLGKMMAPGGTFRMLLPGETAIAVVVRPYHRDKVLELAGITARAWRSYVCKWEDDRMAHRCAGSARGGVTLFFHPQTCCPVPECGAELPPERKQRAAQAEAPFRMNGSSVPRNVLNAGDASRDEEGDALALPLEEQVAVQEPSKIFEAGSTEIAARIKRERDLGLSDHNIAALLNIESIEPPAGFARWTGYGVRMCMGEASRAA